MRCENDTALKYHKCYLIFNSLKKKISNKYGKNLIALFCSSNLKATLTNADINKLVSL